MTNLSRVAACLTVLALGAAFTPVRAAAAAGQAPSVQGDQHTVHQPPGEPAPEVAAPSGMHAKMKMHEQTAAETNAAAARLDARVKEMNAALGESRIAAMAAVIEELVEQQKAAHTRMCAMQEPKPGGHGMRMPSVVQPPTHGAPGAH